MFLCNDAIYIRKAEFSQCSSVDFTCSGRFKNKNLVPDLKKEEAIPHPFKKHFNVFKSPQGSNYYELKKFLLYDLFSHKIFSKKDSSSKNFWFFLFHFFITLFLISMFFSNQFYFLKSFLKISSLQFLRFGIKVL